MNVVMPFISFFKAVNNCLRLTWFRISYKRWSSYIITLCRFILWCFQKVTALWLLDGHNLFRCVDELQNTAADYSGRLVTISTMMKTMISKSNSMLLHGSQVKTTPCPQCNHVIGHVNNIPTMQLFTVISRNTQSKTYMLSWTECFICKNTELCFPCYK